MLRSWSSAIRFAWLSAFAAGALIGIASWRTPQDAAFKRIQAQRVVHVGYAVESPYAYVTPQGRVTGESPETARLIAGQLGWQVEWVQTSFDSLIPDLQAKRFDVIAAGMFVTPDRARLIAFSVPSIEVRPGLLVRRDRPATANSYADLAGGALRVAVLSGSQEQQELMQLGLPPARLLELPTADAGRLAVESEAADVLAISLPTVRMMARQSDVVAAIGMSPAREGDPAALVAFGVARDEPALLAAWNGAAKNVIGSAAHLEAISPFGFTRDDLPQRAANRTNP